MRLPARALLAALVVAPAGCGGGRAELSGAVTYNGTPLKIGAVSVAGADGVVRTVLIDGGGKYRVTDLPAGPTRVAVASPDPGKSRPRARNRDEPPPKAAPAAGWVPIPDRYADFATSGLTATLAAGPNTFDIELK